MLICYPHLLPPAQLAVLLTEFSIIMASNKTLHGWGPRNMACIQHVTYKDRSSTMTNKSKMTITTIACTSNMFYSQLSLLVYLLCISDDRYLPTFVSRWNCVLCTVRCPQCEFKLVVAWVWDLTHLAMQS